MLEERDGSSSARLRLLPDAITHPPPPSSRPRTSPLGAADPPSLLAAGRMREVRGPFLPWNPTRHAHALVLAAERSLIDLLRSTMK